MPGQRQEIRSIQFTPQKRDQDELTKKDMQRFISQLAGEYKRKS
jgi:hypothetical protein